MSDDTPELVALAVIAFCGLAAAAVHALDLWDAWVERRWTA